MLESVTGGDEMLQRKPEPRVNIGCMTGDAAAMFAFVNQKLDASDISKP